MKKKKTLKSGSLRSNTRQLNGHTDWKDWPAMQQCPYSRNELIALLGCNTVTFVCPSCGYNSKVSSASNIQLSDPVCLGCLLKIYGITYDKRKGKSLGLTNCVVCNHTRHCFEAI